MGSFDDEATQNIVVVAQGDIPEDRISMTERAEGLPRVSIKELARVQEQRALTELTDDLRP
eukprot:15395962-Alexandrium_andersonii.AAC.1